MFVGFAAMLTTGRGAFGALGYAAFNLEGELFPRLSGLSGEPKFLGSALAVVITALLVERMVGRNRDSGVPDSFSPWRLLDLS